MATAILKTKSKNDLKLLLDLARKIGISVHKLSDEEAEDLGLVNAIKKGRTREKIDTKRFLHKLRNS